MAVGRRAALAYPLLLGLGAIDAAGYSVTFGRPGGVVAEETGFAYLGLVPPWQAE